MTQPRRMQFEDAIYLVSNRTLEGRAFLKPSPQVNRIIRNLLAWAVDVYDIKAYGFVFLPAGFYMMIGAPHLNLSDFMGGFQSLLAKQVNEVLGRTGQFFAGRYEDSVVEEDMELEELARMQCLPCEAGFVEHPDDWRGVSSWSLHQSGDALTGSRLNRTRARDVRRANPNLSEAEAARRATTTHAVDLEKLPEFADKTHMGYHAEIRRVVEQRASVYADPPEDAVVGMDTIEQDWDSQHQLPRVRERRPRILTRSAFRRARRAETFELRNLQYTGARNRLRRSRGQPDFPRGMIPLHKTRAVGSTTPPGLKRRAELPDAEAA